MQGKSGACHGVHFAAGVQRVGVVAHRQPHHRHVQHRIVLCQEEIMLSGKIMLSGRNKCCPEEINVVVRKK